MKTTPIPTRAVVRRTRKRRAIWINTLVIGGAILFGILASLRPWHVFRIEKLSTQATSREMNKAEDRAVDLTEQRALLEGDVGQERLAREHGYSKPGETVIADLNKGR
jgi:cell division protein FtsB